MTPAGSRAGTVRGAAGPPSGLIFSRREVYLPSTPAFRCLFDGVYDTF